MVETLPKIIVKRTFSTLKKKNTQSGFKDPLL